ncbi:thermonuclease family protein [Mesorhizobium sp. AR10]|uniref:thermonuclease family protein n=1 Tax=Mesorhizobium sp. AR10 TaxID=2865839 RepID=UPI0021605C7F|nr:thermonuclease family protein [Mesorhizobium sp. AR10]UVK38926.1 thermonuclease family protein [Mesorhizobium sp. AR10]
MRPHHAVVAALAILAMAAAVVAGGRVLQRGDDNVGVDKIEANADTVPSEPATSAIPQAMPAKPAVHSRAIDPEIVAPPQLPAEELERVEPRAPLGKLALAVPLKPKMPDDWKGTPLFQPVASAAGLIEAKGYSVAISGIDIIRQDETCSDDGKSWACGIRARTAFRAFLRGRAVICAVPPEGGRDLIAAECRIGKQDVGQWLVENGWARAAAGGRYVEAGDKARAAKKGIFAAAPNLSGLPPAPTPVVAAPTTQQILDPSATEATPPTDQPAPAQ